MSRKSCLFRERMLQSTQIMSTNDKGILVRKQHPVMVDISAITSVKMADIKRKRRFAAAFGGKK